MSSKSGKAPKASKARNETLAKDNADKAAAALKERNEAIARKHAAKVEEAARAKALSGQLPNPTQKPFQLDGRYIRAYKCYDCLVGRRVPFRNTYESVQYGSQIPEGDIVVAAPFIVGSNSEERTVTESTFLLQGAFECTYKTRPLVPTKEQLEKNPNLCAEVHQDTCCETDVPYSFPWRDSHASTSAYLCNACSLNYQRCIVCLKHLDVRCPDHVKNPVSCFTQEGRARIQGCKDCQNLVVRYKHIEAALLNVPMCKVFGPDVVRSATDPAQLQGTGGPARRVTRARAGRTAASRTTASAVGAPSSAGSSPSSTPSNTPKTGATSRRSSSKKRQTPSFEQEDI